ncbi:MAG: hypothetical protein ABI823_11300 [Bryobacteraceae bacterium]
MMKRIALFFAVLAIAAAQNSVDGSLTVGGKLTKLTQAYAFAAQGFFDKDKNDTIVLLTNLPLTEAQVRDEFALRRLAREGKMCFVRETINPAGQIINFSVGHTAFRMSPSGGSTDHLFKGKQDGKIISGKVYTSRSQKSFEDVKYEYSATFKANILPRK